MAGTQHTGVSFAYAIRCALAWFNPGCGLAPRFCPQGATGNSAELLGSCVTGPNGFCTLPTSTPPQVNSPKSAVVCHPQRPPPAVEA